MIKLNSAAVAHLRQLIKSGKINRASAWTFSAADGNALLGIGGADWSAYGEVHLGIVDGADGKTKAAYHYPVAKGGTVYLSALRAAISRAGQQGDAAIQSAARELLTLAKGGMNRRLVTDTLALCFALAGDGNVPDWIEIIPAPNAQGIVAGEDGRSWKLNAQQVAASYRRPIPIDINHSTHTVADMGGESPARGWIEQLEARNGALWGRVQWTDAGATAVRNKDYRFLSPALAVNKAGEIVGVRSVGLVNDPNFDLALNRAELPDDDEEDTDMLKQLLAALGVAEDADETTALNAVSKLKGDLQVALNARGTPDLNAYVPRADYDAVKRRADTAETTLQTNARQALDTAIEAEITAAVKAGKITPATKDFYVATCKAEGGLAKFREFVAAAPVIVPEDQRREGTPDKSTAGALTADQVALCKRMGISEEDYRKSKTALAL